MKNLKKFLALTIVLVMALCMPLNSLALNGTSGIAASGLGNLPAGTYTYVSEKPVAEAGSNAGQVQFIYRNENNLVWAFGSEGKVTTGVETLTGDELEFFKGLYLSDRPVYDWLASAPRDTDGYAGNVAGNLLITISENGKISRLRLDSGLVQMLAILSKDITDDTLTVSGATRGQPNLLHSCITILGSTNCLHLTDQGNVILDNLSIGSNEEGVGLKADKIGGDTFIAGTVTVDGKVEWNCRYANIQPVNADKPATLLTTGKDITMGGMNIGRTGRNLTISTGEGLGGNITIGAVVSVDYGRGAPLPDPSTGTLVLSTSGNIIAGLGDVIIGTNTDRRVNIDSIGNIQGANVIIKPTRNGTPSDIQGSIGDITATGNIDIEIGKANSIGNLTAQSGNITFVSGPISGNVGDITASNGTVDLTIGGVKDIGRVLGAKIVKNIGTESGADGTPAEPTSSVVVVNGKTVAFDAYTINGSNYFKLRDIAYTLSGTEKQFDVYWLDGVANTIITLTSGRTYTVVGGEMKGKGSGTKTAAPTDWTVYLDGKQVSLTSYKIDDGIYFKLRDIARAFDFSVTWDGAKNTIVIDTSKGYPSR